MRQAAVLLAVFLALAAACAEKEDLSSGSKPAPETPRLQGVIIADLLGSAKSYDGREVMISGKVTAGSAVDSADVRSFTLDDGTGSVPVVTKGAVPGENEWVTVRGRVAAPWDFQGKDHHLALVDALTE